jgi:hypothetical protein
MSPHDNALVVTLAMTNHKLHCILVHTRSSVDLLYSLAFEKIRIDKKKVTPMSSPLVGFGGEQVRSIGVKTLPIMAGTAPRQVMVMVDFIIIDRPSAYKAIIGRPALNRLKAIPSIVHLIMKFPIEHGIGSGLYEETKKQLPFATMQLLENQGRERL